MSFSAFLKQRDPIPIFGYLLFIGMMAVGYYYNLTFVQLGLVDLGERILGLSQAQTARDMALLALITCLVALAFGRWMKIRGWSRQFLVKLRLAFWVVAAQTLLTLAVTTVQNEAAFIAWIVLASLALGVGVPVTFSMTVDLIPRRDRGYAAAAITASAYFAAAVFSSRWELAYFRTQVLGIMVLGLISLGGLAFVKTPITARLAEQHKQPEFWFGRYTRRSLGGKAAINRKVLIMIILMFGIYFVDSLGFLRLLATPVYMDSAWQSPQLAPRLFIGVTHVIAALIAGVLYTALNERGLLFWIFGIFAMTHLMYTLNGRMDSNLAPPLAMPMLYAMADSLYTVVNFAIWADVSTPETISINTSYGVALSGWTATFLSTALAIRWQESGMPLERHLQIVDALSMLFFLALITLSFVPQKRTSPPGLAPEQRRSE
jgi:MFS family permease